MINTRTVFVVGAGASVPYFLPSGAELLDAAKNIQGNAETCAVLMDGLPDLITRRANLRNFIDAIKRYRGPSIDCFLEDWPAFRQIGHEVIAALMGPWSNHARLKRIADGVPPEDDWLLYLARKMRDGAKTWERFCDNPITFVTFNFDTVIEEELSETFKGFYGPAADVNRLPEVIHVHGRLPTFGELTQRWIADAALRVKVIHDELDQSVVESARNAIRTADVVCFLGMSYQTPNMDTIDSLALRQLAKQPEFFGTTFRLPRVERERALRWFPAKPDFGDKGCREFLAEHSVLRW